MTAKPETAAGYSPGDTALAERVLLEVWSRLGDFREHLVLVGGLAPRYLVRPAGGAPSPVPPPHAGTMDVDLAVSLAVADLHTYQSMHSALVGAGFEPGKNAGGRDQKHSFVKKIREKQVILDFLTTKYDGPDTSLMREVEEHLSAIQVEGLGLALKAPLRVPVEGELLSGGRYQAEINVCRPGPFVVLKALALDKRGERKDASDLVYVLRHCGDGPESVARGIPDEDRAEASFQKALAVLEARFESVEHDGPVKCAKFTPGEADAAAQAYAAVQDFLAALR